MADAWRVLSTNAELKEAVQWCYDRTLYVDCQGGCKRTIATCRQHGDLPVYLHAQYGPVCSKCYGAHHREATQMAQKVDWQQEYEGKPLWHHAQEQRDAGAGWAEIKASLESLTGQELPSAKAIHAAVGYRASRAGAKPKAAKATPKQPEEAAPVVEAANKPTPVVENAGLVIELNGVRVQVSSTNGTDMFAIAGAVLTALKEVA